MEPGAVLLDLDETLILEERIILASFMAAAATALEPYPELDAARLAVDARRLARDAFRAGPHYEYRKSIGLSSWEGLWCAYEGDRTELAELRAWMPSYRRAAWSAGLAAQSVEDPELAAQLGESFARERRARHAAYPDARPALIALRDAGHTLAVVSNGASDLQREKLAGAGLADLLDVVVVSGDVGVAKPHRAPFDRAIELLRADRATTTMVGDSYRKDVVGAQAAGLRAIHLVRPGRLVYALSSDAEPTDQPAGSRADGVIGGLDELPAALAQLGERGADAPGR